MAVLVFLRLARVPVTILIVLTLIVLIMGVVLLEVFASVAFFLIQTTDSVLLLRSFSSARIKKAMSVASGTESDSVGGAV